MNLKSCAFYLLFIVNIFILSDGATAPDNNDSGPNNSDIYLMKEYRAESQDDFDVSGFLAKIINSELLFSRYEINYLLEAIITYLVKYLEFTVYFSAISDHKNYKTVYRKIENVSSYLDSRSSCIKRSKMLLQYRIGELSEQIHGIVDIPLLSSLTTESGNISKESIVGVSGISKKVMGKISQMVKLLQTLSSLDVDLSLKNISKLLIKISDDCLKMFKGSIKKFNKMDKKEFESRFALRVKKIQKSAISLEITNNLDYLSDMKRNFEGVMQMISAYNTFLETGKTHLTPRELEETKSLIADFFENGDLDEPDVFRSEEFVLNSLELLGLAALNLSLFNSEMHIKLKNEVEAAWESVMSMIKYRGTEIVLSQTVVLKVREEVRSLMECQKLVCLDFTMMNLDNSLMENDLISYIYSFYDSLLRIYELVRREQSRNIEGKYIRSLYSNVNPLFEKTLDNYKSIILSLKKTQSSSEKKKTKKYKISRKRKTLENSRQSLKVSGRRHSRHSNKSTKKRRVIISIGKGGFRKSNYLTEARTSRKGTGEEPYIQPEKKSEKQMALCATDNAQLLRALKIMESQLSHLLKMNYVDIISILESTIGMLNEILASEGVYTQESDFGADFSEVISGLRSIGDQTNDQQLLFEIPDTSTVNNFENSNSNIPSTDAQCGVREKCTDQSSVVSKEKKKGSKPRSRASTKSRKSIISRFSKRRADEKVKPIDEVSSTVELFGESPVFANQAASKLLFEFDESGNIIAKQLCSKSRKASKKRRFFSSSKKGSQKSSMYIEGPVKITTNEVSNNVCECTSEKQISCIGSSEGSESIRTKKSINKRTLFMVVPDILDKDLVSSIVSRYNIKFLNFSNLSLSSPYSQISQAITTCFNETVYLYYDIYLFLSGIEKMVLKQVVIQMIILTKNLIAVLVAKDKRKMKILNRGGQ
ncbi:hypothetical protein OIY81_2530 [Cryptosporidium canis]|nr:hypothetical protein OIY81_2530 [Cryptosporidium canis]